MCFKKKKVINCFENGFEKRKNSERKKVRDDFSFYFFLQRWFVKGTCNGG